MARGNTAERRSADRVPADNATTLAEAADEQPISEEALETTDGASPEQLPVPFYSLVLAPDLYMGREHYAARDAVHDRNGIFRALRRALRDADGRSVTIEIQFR